MSPFFILIQLYNGGFSWEGEKILPAKIEIFTGNMTEMSKDER